MEITRMDGFITKAVSQLQQRLASPLSVENFKRRIVEKWGDTNGYMAARLSCGHSVTIIDEGAEFEVCSVCYERAMAMERRRS
jgi:hypothetical protein